MKKIKKYTKIKFKIEKKDLMPKLNQLCDLAKTWKALIRVAESKPPRCKVFVCENDLGVFEGVKNLHRSH